MLRQDKAISEKHARTLRELVKKPENKACADCKRNDPRWASWNIGVFLCIRCSGIHRGMGTHISKVKSVDLDVWTPEQMESIQKWGNRRANIYWEAHLKTGHIPPEHKMESFIRSKYESRRWAMEGLPPQDPSVLEQSEPINGQQDTQETQKEETAKPPPPSGPAHVKTNSTTVIGQPAQQTHQLLSTHFSNAGPNSSTSLAPLKNAIAEPKLSAPDNDLFSLDFHAPSAPAARESASTTLEQPKKDVKQDILSLYSTTKPVPTSTAVFNATTITSASASASPWTPGVADSHKAPTSMIGTNGVGAWGTSSGWTGTVAQPNLWGNSGMVPQPSQSSLFNTTDIWNTPTSSKNQLSHDLFTTSTTSMTQNVVKKDDVFGDLWSGNR